MFEIFFHYKVCRITPGVTIAKNDGKDVFQSFTLPALYGFISTPSTSTMLTRMLTLAQIQALLQKAEITKQELVLQDLSQDELAKKAFVVAQEVKGTFVTTLDVMVAYLLLTEEKTKLLFNKSLKQADLSFLAQLVQERFPYEETPQKTRVRFSGAGIGEGLVSGWTPETQKYTENFTAYALREEPVWLGRDREFRLMLEGLLKMENNNVLLTGEIGSGKENLVQALAYESFSGKLGGGLDYKRVFLLLLGPLTAGVANRSDLEVRLQNIIAEISHAHDVILYIPDFQNVIGATSYELDLSGVLLPYLKAGHLPIIATMTTGSFKTYMEQNPLKEAFTVIPLSEPDPTMAKAMVFAKVTEIEKKYHVVISYLSIVRAVELAGRFLTDQALPGSALSLLETVANSVSLSSKIANFPGTKQKLVQDGHVVQQVETTTHVAIATPQGEERDLLLNLEAKLHERVIDQEDAIRAISEAMRRARSGMKTSSRPISFLFLGPTGVGKTETAKTLAELYFGGEANMIRLDMSEYSDEVGVKRLLGAPPGEGNERGELTDKVHDKPSSLVLLDEFEKAHPKIHNLFLQVLDDGRLTDNKGRTVSFSNCIIIVTSNAGSEFIREELAKGTPTDRAFHTKLLDYLQTKAIFKPELLNRFDDVITFRPLGQEQVMEVTKLLLHKLSATLAAQDITLIVTDEVIAKIAKEGFDRDFGARPLRRYIQDTLEDMLSKKKLTDELTRGKTATFSVDESGQLQLVIS